MVLPDEVEEPMEPELPDPLCPEPEWLPDEEPEAEPPGAGAAPPELEPELEEPVELEPELEAPAVQASL